MNRPYIFAVTNNAQCSTGCVDPLYLISKQEKRYIYTKPKVQNYGALKLEFFLIGVCVCVWGVCVGCVCGGVCTTYYTAYITCVK